jgi:hypothetical protein
MLALDGFAVLRAIGAHPDAFSEIDAVVAKTARDLIAKRLNLKSLTAQDARTVRHALGEPFDLIVDEMNAANLKSLVAKLDKHNPDLKRSNPELHRRHLRALLNGTVEPAEKTKTTSKTANKASQRQKTADSPPTPPGFRTEAMSVFRESLKRK